MKMQVKTKKNQENIFFWCPTRIDLGPRHFHAWWIIRVYVVLV